MKTQSYDVVIIGGGINGCGIAAEAAQRGLSVLLLEKDDLGSKTSSKSSNLIHGGLRYLEHFEFSLVKKALDERQVLLNVAPHLVKPAQFVLPYVKKMRPAWLMRLGLFIYDHLSRKNQLPSSKTIYRHNNAAFFTKLQPTIVKGLVYSDAITNDARLCIENAIQARAYGAQILPHSPFVSAQYQSSQWEVHYQHQQQPWRCHARCLINAAGPWVNEVITKIQTPLSQPIALIKGSHIVVSKLYEGSHAYMLQHPDKRIVFVAPYHDFTMIGTTDVRLDKIPRDVSISPDESHYLLAVCNQYFTTTLTPKDIVSSWSGIRPLLEDDKDTAQTLSRDYRLSFEYSPGPLLNIYGGKITTYRQLAVEAIEHLKGLFSTLLTSQSHCLPLPGAAGLSGSLNHFHAQMSQKYQWMEQPWLKAMLSRYGTRCRDLLKDAHSIDDLGQHFGHGLFQIEVDWLMQEEWAQDMEDILWRRTKLGLSFSVEEKNALHNYLLKV